jgi:hypothetical protein
MCVDEDKVQSDMFIARRQAGVWHLVNALHRKGELIIPVPRFKKGLPASTSGPVDCWGRNIIPIYDADVRR